jgi:hypothetical protein
MGRTVGKEATKSFQVIEQTFPRREMFCIGRIYLLFAKHGPQTTIRMLYIVLSYFFLYFYSITL